MKRGVIIFVLLLLSISYTNAAIMHPASSIIINVDSTSRNLDAGASYFIGTHSFSIASLTAGQHDASQVWVSVKDGEMNLLQALQSINKLCPNPSNPITYSTSPSDKSKPYHFATEVTFSSGNLQTAINVGTFCGCTPGTTRAKDCDYLDNTCANYNDVTETCSSSGTWNNPSCNSVVYTAKGTTCTTDKTCDGAGNCLGWADTGCGGCPFGTTSEGTPTGMGGQINRCKLKDSNGISYQGIVIGYMSDFSYDGSNGEGEIQCSWIQCCWWQVFCWTARCTTDYSWKIKP
jgi:hypothetical protein